MTKKITIIVAVALSLSFTTNAQVSINTDGADPDSSAMLEAKSTDKGFLPPRMTETQRDAISNPAAGLQIFNSTTNQPNYFNGSIWVQFDGRAAETLTVGDFYQGGKIAYIFQSGDPGYIEGETHGLIAAASDQSTGKIWGCYETGITGADGIALGTGYQNTLDIVAGCSAAGIAARICNDLELNNYSDWYLPSKDELNKLYVNRVAVGGFAGDDTFYWSSSEDSNARAWEQKISTGYQYNESKYQSDRVRAVRTF